MSTCTAVRRFARDIKGSVAVIFSLSLPVLLFAIGVAVDYAGAARTRAKLQDIADTAALASNNANVKTDDDADVVARNYISAHHGPDMRLINDPTIKVKLTDAGRTTTLTISGGYKTSILSAFKPSLPIAVASVVKRGGDNTLELALVLDTTYSMTESNKIATLKSAAKTLTQTLMGDTRNQVKMAVVPFAQYVNVGLGNRNAVWLTRSDDYSETKTVTPACYNPQTTCKVTSTRPKQTCTSQNCRTETTVSYNDGVPVYGTRTVCDNVCTTSGTEDYCSEWNYGPQYCPPSTTQTTKYKWNGCVGSRAHPNNLDDTDATTIKYPALYNITCASPIQPLTNIQGQVISSIETLTPQGLTYMPAGLIWGMNVLSPAAPFTEGAAFDPDKKKPRKAMVFMTDGLNTKSMTSKTATTHNGSNTTEANTYTSTLCTNAKAKGIEVYTVMFMVSDSAVRTMLQGCASSPQHYFDATDATALTTAFADIAFRLQQPYVAR